MSEAPPVPLGRRAAAALRLRCPVCLEGALFEGLYRMRQTCPRCGVRFEREPGYFLGAYYFSYGMGIAVAIPLWLVLSAYGVGVAWSTVMLLVVLALLSPLFFRYGRAIWLQFDEVFDPRPPGPRER